MSSAGIPLTFKPSPEQTRLASIRINPGVLVMVSAYAGAGKTTTLEYFTRCNPNKRFLYLVFASKNAIEAKGRFPENVHCTTVHGLAKERYGKRYFDAGKISTNGTKPADLVKKYSITYEVALHVVKTIASYLNSSNSELSYNSIPAVNETSGALQNKILEYAKKELMAMRDLNDPTSASHDLYLKDWMETAPKLTEYDCILVDEAQDSNRVTLRLVMDQWSTGRCALVFVGDRHQNVFGFRDTVNAMELYAKKATATINLSESYRFTPRIGQMASSILYHFKDEVVPVVGKAPMPEPDWLKKAFESNARWRGEPGRKFGDLPPKDARYPSMCILSRTNGSLIRFAISLITANPEKKIHFAGTSKFDNWSPRKAYLFAEIEEACKLSLARSGPPPELKTELLKNFKSWNEFESYANDNQDNEALRIIGLVKAITPEELPLRLQEIESACGPDSTYTTLATAHKSKGLEWDRVKILGDFKSIHLPSVRNKLDIATIEAEANLLYVAITRARKECVISKPDLAIWLSMPMEKQRDVLSGKLVIEIPKTETAAGQKEKLKG